MEPDFEELASRLKALSHPSRLEILYQLRAARAAADLDIRARQLRGGLGHARRMSRQSVQEHLNQLMELDLVEGVDGASRASYIVRGDRLFQLMEAFRDIGVIVEQAPRSEHETVTTDALRPREVPDEPHLVVVRGLREGRTYTLDDSDGQTEWTIGRGAQCDVRIGQDPYVSLLNSRIVADGGFVLRDAGTSRNGTFLNWSNLSRGSSASLRPGDILGVGRTLLVFRDGA